jgi:hypothetical protein
MRNFDTYYRSLSRANKKIQQICLLLLRYLSQIRAILLHILHTRTLTETKVMVVDRRRDHKRSRYCCRIWNMSFQSVCKVPNRKFFCRRERANKTSRKIDFTGGTSVVRGKGFSLMPHSRTHIYTRMYVCMYIHTSYTLRRRENRRGEYDQ